MSMKKNGTRLLIAAYIYSFMQKEKRKRDEGKVSRTGSHVEEEKRRARAFGVYSGFD
jgi:hypothetical protein